MKGNTTASEAVEDKNYTIISAQRKAERLIMTHSTPTCSISGGSDSDIMLDMIYRADPDKKVKYYFCDTGLEYQATKDHLSEVESRYGIKIERIRPAKPIPTCVREYGVPFISKYVSEMISRLQRHNFRWEDEPFEVLIERYPKCYTALIWWCNHNETKKGDKINTTRFGISHNKYLKEFMIANPPIFPISARCCDVSKKKPLEKFKRAIFCDLDMTGVRKAEGGIRNAIYKNCYTTYDDNYDTFRPIFWFNDDDKKAYENAYGVQHSRCYTVYGMRRTGCVGCPFSIHMTEEWDAIKRYEPALYKAIVAIFGKSYEYTMKYREFVKIKNQKYTKKVYCRRD
jgi:3'-phosphoadenosine 5'-phosphosulfate sulfotransferase (PAPS reductase)/FAD synthetase